jgi:pyruvate/2-oxoglutarate dehydrogenase complex dihydrolipoamide acyltransferase (E2) component
MADRVERLDWAERWMGDVFRLPEVPGGIVLHEVDMTRAKEIVDRLREEGVPATYLHVVLRSIAMNLLRNPEYNKVQIGSRRLISDRIDIAVSAAGSSVNSPVIMLEDAGSKTVRDIAFEIQTRAGETREVDRRNIARMRRFGWIVPFRFMRVGLMRLFYNRLRVRRRMVGTVQVTCLPQVDVLVPLVTATVGAVGLGGVRDRVIAVDGKPGVRPVLIIATVGDHKALSGLESAVRFADGVKLIESGNEIEAELWDQIPAARGLSSQAG